MLRAYVRDAGLNRVIEVDAVLSLEWSHRWVDVGGWLLELPTSSDAAAELLRQGAGLVVVDDATGAVEMSGPVLPTAGGASSAGTRTVRTVDGAAVDVLQVVGETDNVHMRDRVVVPPTGSSHDVRTGAAGAVVAGLIADHLGHRAGARSDARVVLPMVVPAGGHVSASGRYQSLLELVRDVCVLGGVSVDIRQAGGVLAVTIEETRDRSDVVVFSAELGSVAAMEIAATPTTGNVAYVAGQGEGVDRMVVEVDQVPAGSRRIERFVDRRDIEDRGLLVDAGRLWLADNFGEASIVVEPSNDSGAAVFGVDYDMGDLVAVQIDRALVTHRVVGASRRIAPDVDERTLTIGALDQSGAAALLGRDAALRRRVSVMERI